MLAARSLFSASAGLGVRFTYVCHGRFDDAVGIRVMARAHDFLHREPFRLGKSGVPLESQGDVLGLNKEIEDFSPYRLAQLIFAG